MEAFRRAVEDSVVDESHGAVGRHKVDDRADVSLVAQDVRVAESLVERRIAEVGVSEHLEGIRDEVRLHRREISENDPRHVVQQRIATERGVGREERVTNESDLAPRQVCDVLDQVILYAFHQLDRRMSIRTDVKQHLHDVRCRCS